MLIPGTPYSSQVVGELARGVRGLATVELAWGLAIGAVAVAVWLRWPRTRAVVGLGPVVGLALAVGTRSWTLAAVAAAVAVAEHWTGRAAEHPAAPAAEHPPAPAADVPGAEHRAGSKAHLSAPDLGANPAAEHRADAAAPARPGLAAPLPAVALPVVAAAVAVRPPDAALVAVAAGLVLLARSRPYAPAFAIAALGWYAGLPDTEAALAVLGAAAAAVRPPAVGWASAVGVGAAVVMVGAGGRTGATVGGLLCLATAVVAAHVGHPAALVAQLAIVAYASRVVATGELVLAVPVVVVLVGSGLLLVVRSRRHG